MSETTSVKSKIIHGSRETEDGRFQPYIAMESITKMPKEPGHAAAKSIDTFLLWQGPLHTHEWDAYEAADLHLFDRLTLLFNTPVEE